MTEIRAIGRAIGNHQLCQVLDGYPSHPMQSQHIAFAGALQLKKTARSRQSKLSPVLGTQSDLIKAAIRKGDFNTSPTMPVSDPRQQSVAGAFFYLDRLSPVELIHVIESLTSRDRAALLENLNSLDDGLYRRDRLRAALRSVAWQTSSSGTIAISIIDELSSGALQTETIIGLAANSRTKQIEVLRALTQEQLKYLQHYLVAASFSGREQLAYVIADLLSSNVELTASDVIDLAAVKGSLKRMMASIYNTKGGFIQELAQSLGIPTSAAAGIMKVESGGKTFDKDTNKPIVRFENHVFWDRWGSRTKANTKRFNDHFDFRRKDERHKDHRFRVNSNDTFEPCHKSQSSEWQVIDFAAALSDRETAYQCASFGSGQIMGFNHGLMGYNSAVAMVEAYEKSERVQIRGIFDFIRSNRLESSIRRGDYEKLARVYNGAKKGSKKEQEYATAIRTAAQAYEAVTRGKKHTIPAVVPQQ